MKTSHFWLAALAAGALALPQVRLAAQPTGPATAPPAGAGALGVTAPKYGTWGYDATTTGSTSTYAGQAITNTAMECISDSAGLPLRHCQPAKVNAANANTAGYKARRVQFQDLLYQNRLNNKALKIFRSRQISLNPQLHYRFLMHRIIRQI